MPTTPTGTMINLGDGTSLPESYCGYNDRDLWCFIQGYSMIESMQMFSDAEKVSVIESFYSKKGYRYTGFTELLMVQKENEQVNVRLTWPEGAPHSVEEIPWPEPEPDTEETTDAEGIGDESNGSVYNQNQNQS